MKIKINEIYFRGFIPMWNSGSYFYGKKELCIRQILHLLLNTCAYEFKGAEDYEKQTWCNIAAPQHWYLIRTKN